MTTKIQQEFKEAVDLLLIERNVRGKELRNLDNSLSKTKFKQLSNAANNPEAFYDAPEEIQSNIYSADKDDTARKNLNWLWSNDSFRPKNYLDAHPEFWHNYVEKPDRKKKIVGQRILDKDKFINALTNFMQDLPEENRIDPNELITTDPDKPGIEYFNKEHPWVKNKTNRQVYADKYYYPWVNSNYGQSGSMGAKTGVSKLKHYQNASDEIKQNFYDQIKIDQANKAARNIQRGFDNNANVVSADILSSNTELKNKFDSILKDLIPEDGASYNEPAAITKLFNIMQDKKLNNRTKRQFYDALYEKLIQPAPNTNGESYYEQLDSNFTAVLNNIMNSAKMSEGLINMKNENNKFLKEFKESVNKLLNEDFEETQEEKELKEAVQVLFEVGRKVKDIDSEKEIIDNASKGIMNNAASALSTYKDNLTKFLEIKTNINNYDKKWYKFGKPVMNANAKKELKQCVINGKKAAKQLTFVFDVLMNNI